MTATFADTNILVYAATPLTAPSRAKSEIARAVLAENEIVISTQVLQEFYWAATRPHKLNLTHTDAVGWLDIFKRFPVQPITLSVVEDALFLCASYQLSYWDAAIIAAARHLDCRTLTVFCAAPTTPDLQIHDIATAPQPGDKFFPAATPRYRRSPPSLAR